MRIDISYQLFVSMFCVCVVCDGAENLANEEASENLMGAHKMDL